MSRLPLISAILRKPWAIEPRWAESHLNLVSQIFEGRQAGLVVAEDDEESKYECAYLLESGMMVYDKAEVKESAIAMHEIKGSLMKADYCGEAGMERIGSYIKEADTVEHVSHHLILFDTPGGTVDGTETLSSIIKNTQKPTIALVDGMACSAGLWLASQCDEIYLSGKTSEVGSCGVMVSFRDYKGYFEKHGIKDHYVNARTSPDKNKAALEAKDGKYELLQDELDKIHLIFKETVKEGLSNVKDEALTGKVYMGQDAIDMGLANGFKTLDELVAHIQKSNTEMFGSKYPKANAAWKKAQKGEALTDDEIKDANAELEENEVAVRLMTADHLAEADSQADQLKAKETELSQANEKVTTLETNVKNVEKERDDWKQKAEAYGKKPGAAPTNTKSEKPEAVETDDDDEWFDPNAEHNKRAAMNENV